MRKLTTIRRRINSGQATRRMLDGRPHMVAPAVLLVEGVHNGLYYPAPVLAHLPETWNGQPLTNGHPKDDGGYLSANAPNVLDRYGLGRVFNVRWDEGKLRGDIWIDIERARDINPAILGMVERGEPLELSTGLYTEESPEGGTWNGEEYVAVVVDIYADHLALLPDDVGACSWRDGCGVRTNTEGEGMSWKRFATIARWLVKANEVSFDEVRESLQRALASMDNSEYMHFVVDVFTDSVVYEAWERGGDSSEFYRRDYTLNEETGEVTLAEESVEVRPERTYVPVANEAAGELSTKDHKPLVRGDDYLRYVTTLAVNADTCQCHASGDAPEADAGETNRAPEVREDEDMSKASDRVVALIANEQTQFTEDDRAWLESLEEAQLDKLAPVEAATSAEPKVNEPAPGAPKEGAEAAQAEPTIDEFVANAPREVREYLENAVAAERRRKADLVASLTGNETCPFSKDELEDKSIGELEKLATWRGPKVVDYSGQGGGEPTTNVGSETHMQAPDPFADSN